MHLFTLGYGTWIFAALLFAFFLIGFAVGCCAMVNRHEDDERLFDDPADEWNRPEYNVPLAVRCPLDAVIGYRVGGTESEAN